MTAYTSAQASGDAVDSIVNQASINLSDVLDPSPEEIDLQDPPCAESSDATSSAHSRTITAIGIVLMNRKFKCSERQCGSKTFNRPAELRRHYLTIHASQKPEFWCHVPACNRSAALGIKSFSRKDKLEEHIRKSHEGVGDYEPVDVEVDSDKGSFH